MHTAPCKIRRQCAVRHKTDTFGAISCQNVDKIHEMRTKNGFSCAFLVLWAVLRGHIGTNRGISAQMAGRDSRKKKSG